MKRLLPIVFAAAAFGLCSAPAAAQDEPGDKVNTVIIYGDDACPASAEGEIVVCARLNEDERYRIPEPLRRSSDPPQLGGISRVEALEESQRDTRPGGCSVVGSFGHTGCTQELIRQWYADRRGRRARR